jgi:hypothetical protein
MIVGAVVLVLGAAMAAFGIPVQEFSFGNTLILAGATLAAGGLIVIALGVVSGQLQHLADALVHAPAAGHESFAPMPAAGAAGEPHPFEPRGPSAPPEFPMPPQPAPMLRNPDDAVDVAEDVSLSPQPGAEREPTDERDVPAWMRTRPAAEKADERRRSSIFDSMWPSENKMFGGAEKEEKNAAPEPPPPEPAPSAPPALAEPPPPAEKPKPRAVAILKSGVVDGMSYTLYVDGSIEAELPQGTLHFASIHELRAHLEQNG